MPNVFARLPRESQENIGARDVFGFLIHTQNFKLIRHETVGQIQHVARTETNGTLSINRNALL